MRHRILVALILYIGSTLAAAVSRADDSHYRAAVERVLPLVQSSAVEFTKQRECFSCHHQALPVQVMRSANTRGFNIDQGVIDQQVNWTTQFLKRNQQRYLEGQGQGGQADTAGYALWTLAIAEYPADDLTAAVCQYLLVRQADQDHWSRTSTRPPSEASDFTTTFLAIQALQHYATAEQQEPMRERLKRAGEWLEKTTANDTEDLVFRLRGLHALQVDPQLIQQAAAQLLDQQHEDGSWSQNKELASDAYATGSALVALLDCGTLTSSDPRYVRGLEWLVANQSADGTWHVVTRSEPIQVYFESGFPHAKDQFISMSATCWAMLALLAALPPEMPGVNATEAPAESSES